MCAASSNEALASKVRESPVGDQAVDYLDDDARSTAAIGERRRAAQDLDTLGAQRVGRGGTVGRSGRGVDDADATG